MEEQKSLPYPYEFKHVEPEEQEEYNKLCDLFNLKCMRVGPKGYLLYEHFKKDAANIYNMPLRSTDIFVASYQRSGTTLTQELVWLLASELDYERAVAVPLGERFPFLDGFMLFDLSQVDYLANAYIKRNEIVDVENIKQSLEIMSTPLSSMISSMPDPRFIKTHLPMSLLNPKLLDTAKVVYVARDPRDVAVSNYYLSKLFQVMRFPAGFKDFWKIFNKGLYVMCPYFDHVKEAWDQRHHPNMLFLFYEELTKDLPASIRRVANFLGKELNEGQMDRLCDHLNIENFRKNASVNLDVLKELGMLTTGESFIRKGKTGGWRDYFDEKMTQQAETWIEENLRGTDLRFPSMNNAK